MDDLISRQQAIGEAERWLYDGDDKRTIGEMLRDLPEVQPEQRWIPVTETPPRGRDLMLKIHDACNSFFYYHMGFHDGEKYFTYNFFWQRDKDLEIVGWQLCPWEEGEQE